MTQAPDEREAIVRWLREQGYKASADAMTARRKEDRYALAVSGHHQRVRADQIERGEHLGHISEQGEG